MNAARVQRLLSLLDETEWKTAQQLADALGRSEKTVRAALRDLDALLAANGAALESKPRYGYRLQVSDRVRFEALAATPVAQTSALPETSEQRADYIIMGMLFLMDYVKAQDLCDVLFISSTTLSAVLKRVEEIVQPYGLSLERRPNHGMRLVGREIDIRNLLTERYLVRDELPIEFGQEAPANLKTLADLSRGLLAQHGVRLSEFAFQSFATYSFVAWSRVLSGFTLPPEDYDELDIEPAERAVAQGLVEAIHLADYTEHVDAERRYLELYLAGKRIVGSVAENDANFVITEKADRITLEILSLLSRDFDIDLLNNFDLRMSLNQHLAPMDIRLRYGIQVSNPLLEQTRENYPLAFQMAKLAGGVLQRHYGCEIPADELGYIALILQLGVEKWRLEHKRSILIVCGAGKSTARLLRHRFEQKFKDALDRVYTCDSLELDSFDFDQVSFVFTTVPIAIAIPKPIVEVGQFLEGADISKVDHVLRGGSSAGVAARYIGPDRVIGPGELDLAAPSAPDTQTTSGEPAFISTKSNVLRALCARIAQAENVDPSFYDMVLARDCAIQMRLSNGVALPHPDGIASAQTFAYVAVLDQPIAWNEDGDEAQLIILVSMGRNDEGDTSRSLLNEALARFVLDEDAVDAFLERPTYDMFEALLES